MEGALGTPALHAQNRVYNDHDPPILTTANA